jgi:thiaminase
MLLRQFSFFLTKNNFKGLNASRHITTGRRQSLYNAALLEKIGPIYCQIEKHPFFEILKDKTLSADVFKELIEQDQLFLRAHAEDIKIVADRMNSPNSVNYQPEYANALLAFSDDMHQWGLNMQKTYLGKSSHTVFQQAHHVQPCREIKAYMEYSSVTTRMSSIPEALGCLQACPDVYHKKLSMKMKASALDITHPYHDFLASSYNPRYIKHAMALDHVMNAYINKLTSSEICQVVDVKMKSALYELKFLDYLFLQEKAYRRSENIPSCPWRLQ